LRVPAEPPFRPPFLSAATRRDGSDRPPLVGRERELAALERVLGELDEDAARVLVVSGEPGIGKTRLLGELARLAAQRDYVVLAGRGTELELDVPFGLVIEAFDDYLRQLQVPRLDELTRRLPELAAVLPASAELAVAAPTAATERYRHHRAIRELIEELAAERPMVLILDDLHWADPASAEAVAHLLRRPPQAPVLLALSHRPAGLRGDLSIALDAVAREPRVLRLQPAALLAADAHKLLAGSPEPLRLRIIKESGGNPLYIEQLLRAASDPAAGGRTGNGTDGTGPPTPAGIVATVAEELRRLPDDGRALLEGAAIAGEPFEPGFAAGVGAVPPDQAPAALDELTARDLVRPEPSSPEFRFRHPVVRRAVYDSIPAGRRLAGHRTAADLLAAGGAPAAPQAHHLAVSARHGDERAIAVLNQAALDSLRSAPASAAHWLSVAISVLPADRPAQRLEMLSTLAQAQSAAGRLGDARETLVTATAGLSPGTAAWAAAVAALASVELALGSHGGARRRLEDALELVGERAPERVPLLVELAVEVAYQGDFRRAVRISEEAEAIAIRLGDRGLRGLARSVLVIAHSGTGDIAAGRAECAQAAADLDGLTDLQLSGRLGLAHQLGLGECFLEHYADAARHLNRGIEIALEYRQGQFLVQSRASLTLALYHQGEVGAAIRAAEEAVETGRLLAVPGALAWALSVSALAWSVVDARIPTALGDEAMALLADVDDSIISDASRAHFGLALVNIEQHQRAGELIDQAGAPDFERFEPGRRCFLAEARVRCALAADRLDDARAWTELAEGFAAGLELRVAVAAVGRCRALLLLAEGEADQAARLALDAVRAAGQAGASLEAERSRIVAGRALAAAGARDQAVAELRIARTQLAECGSRRLADQAGRELRALGVTAPSPVARKSGDAGTVELSGREREIAALVADGYSNRDIARLLYLSPKTIEGHMSRIFAKLEIGSRAQLAAIVGASAGAGSA
jgi:DNA-binding NarL/FixJ family response regulator/tetratricopeptide (TPR) repeat protein